MNVIKYLKCETITQKLLLTIRIFSIDIIKRRICLKSKMSKMLILSTNKSLNAMNHGTCPLRVARMRKVSEF